MFLVRQRTAQALALAAASINKPPLVLSCCPPLLSVKVGRFGFVSLAQLKQEFSVT
jgi:hypothetical protein